MKRQIFILTILTFIIGFGLTSCSTILSKLYGIKEKKPVDENTIYRYSKKYDIPSEDCYEMDTSYLSFLKSFDTTIYKTQIKNHYQPLQALYFDETGQLQSFHVNCNAGGFPNLKWNRNNIMQTFPPGQQTPEDSILSLDEQLEHLKPLSQTKKFNPENFEYIVVVYWNRFMGRQSEKLVQVIQENCKIATDKKVKIIYVNNDNIFARQ